MSTMTTYTATLTNGTTVTRKTARTYTHVVEAVRRDTGRTVVIGWAGRLDLAMKLVARTQAARQLYSDVAALPVAVAHVSTPRGEWLAPAVTAVAAAAADVDPDQWVEQYLAELQVCGALTFREMVAALKRWHERRGVERIGDAVTNAAALVIEFLDPPYAPHSFGPFTYRAVSGLDFVVGERDGAEGAAPVSADALYDAAVLLAEGARADLVGVLRGKHVPYAADLRDFATVSGLVYDVTARYQRAAAEAGQRMRVVGL